MIINDTKFYSCSYVLYDAQRIPAKIEEIRPPEVDVPEMSPRSDPRIPPVVGMLVILPTSSDIAVLKKIRCMSRYILGFVVKLYILEIRDQIRSRDCRIRA